MPSAVSNSSPVKPGGADAVGHTFSLKNARFEAPRDLRNRKVPVRFDRLHFERAIVY